MQSSSWRLSYSASRWPLFSRPAVPLSAQHSTNGIRRPGANRRVFFHPGQLGVSLGLLPTEGQSLILAGAIISIALNPLVFRAIDPAQVWIRARSKLAQTLERPDDPLAVLPMTVDLNRLTGQVVLVGYGRVGRRIGEALTANGISLCRRRGES